jgi:hypothetical protein
MNVVYNIATFEKELIMKYKYDANEVIPADMTKQVHVELTNGWEGITTGSNIEWQKCANSPVVSWEYAVVYDHTELKSNHVDGDWYQYSRGGIRWFDIQTHLFILMSSIVNTPIMNLGKATWKVMCGKLSRDMSGITALVSQCGSIQLNIGSTPIRNQLRPTLTATNGNHP